MPAASLTGISKTFGSVKALKGVNLELEEGTLFGLLGPNGSGKSTLLKILMGLQRPTGGELSLLGRSPGHPKSRAVLGYMPQNAAVYPGLTVKENFSFFGKLYGLKGDALEERCRSMMELLELDSKEKTPVKYLSGGMVRRVLLGTAVIHRPRFLILDEPTAGLDPVLRQKCWDWLTAWRAEGMTILLTTHHISEANRSREIAFLREGKILDRGTPADLMDKYGSEDLEKAFIKATGEEKA